jgi:hypothetical protein
LVELILLEELTTTRGMDGTSGADEFRWVAEQDPHRPSIDGTDQVGLHVDLPVRSVGQQEGRSFDGFDGLARRPSAPAIGALLDSLPETLPSSAPLPPLIDRVGR